MGNLVRSNCPACQATPLRAFHGRMCCDTCHGMQLSLDELNRAVVDLAGVVVAYEYVGEKRGTRACPQCPATMNRCKLRVMFDEHRPTLEPVLDRCEQHGLWFDGEELARVLEQVRGKAAIPVAPAGSWFGRVSVFDWWKL